MRQILKPLYALSLAGAALLLHSCGYPGDILPPALNIPIRVTDLKAIERGSKIVVTFTVPPLTTENMKIDTVTPDLRIGPPLEAGQTTSAWAQSANTTRIPVDEQKPGPVTAQFDATAYAGKDVAVAIRLAGSKGRWSDWSGAVQFAVIPPLKTPVVAKLDATARGIKVTWTSAGLTGVTYKILRQGPGETEPAAVGTVTDETSFVDTSAKYNVAYQYTVQASKDNVQSDIAPAQSLTAIDTFAPEVPTGVTALAGISTIELNWERNTDPDFAEFRVYRTEAGGGARTKIAEKVFTPVYTDRQIQSGKRYQYTITAVDRVGNESQPSAPAEAVAP